MTEEILETDILIIGAGPSGLSAAIRLAQHAQLQNRPITIMVLEKGAEVGAHILSGAALETRALDELIPDWKERGAPVTTRVTKDQFRLLTKKYAIPLPVPPQMNNHQSYIISLGRLCQWLAAHAEALGVQIMPGFAASELWIENGQLVGVKTGAFGIAKDGSSKPNYQPPLPIKAKYTLFAEGCRGSLSRQLMECFDLRKECQPQTYGIGIKELWEIPPAQHQEGLVTHTVGWPLDSKTYGGSFIYHAANNQVAIGYIIGLDYQNPYLDPFKEFQRFKTHPSVSKILKGGKRICYGSRAISEGGVQSQPQLIFPGGALIGDAAGFLNVPKIKGTHTAMKSGMLAADAVWEQLDDESRLLTRYPEIYQQSWLCQELKRARNIRPAFKWGLLPGIIYSAIDTFVFFNRAPWTLKHRKPDHDTLKQQGNCKRIDYPKPDNQLMFDRLSSVFLSNTNHEENQPCHLRLKDAAIPVTYNLPEYDAPEQRYCPAGVYEIIEKAGQPALQINAQNCVHCKTCDIKDPTQNIVWVPPEGGGGPNYTGM